MDITMEIGEAFVGEGGDAAHVNTVLGSRAGPVGSAFATGLAGPTEGHAGFIVIGQPGIMAVPPTLFVNKATITGPEHGRMTWGPAQAGVAKGIASALEEGVIDRADAAGLLLIAAVWVNPAAADEAAVFANTPRRLVPPCGTAVTGTRARRTPSGRGFPRGTPSIVPKGPERQATPIHSQGSLAREGSHRWRIRMLRRTGLPRLPSPLPPACSMPSPIMGPPPRSTS